MSRTSPLKSQDNRGINGKKMGRRHSISMYKYIYIYTLSTKPGLRLEESFGIHEVFSERGELIRHARVSSIQRQNYTPGRECRPSVSCDQLFRVYLGLV